MAALLEDENASKRSSESIRTVVESHQAKTPLEQVFEDKLFLSFLMACLFHKFLESDEFRSWVLSTNSINMIHAHCTNESARSLRNPSICMTTSVSVDTMQHTLKNALRSVPGLGNTSSLRKTLSSNSWLQGFVQYLDDAPIAVSIADAGKLGFPTMYINKHFTDRTGYTYADVRDKPLSMLQCEETELGTIETMSIALHRHSVAKVSLTNKTKSGQTFLNALTLNPVVDKLGEYKFVVAVYIDPLSPQVKRDLIMSDLITMLLPHALVG
eukprot:gene30406-36737_t